MSIREDKNRYHQANKKLGQHFLTNKATTKQMVAQLSASHCDAVLEIGPGRGALTHWLVRQVEQPLYLIEIDQTLATHLAKHYGQPRVEVINDDFLTWPLTTLAGKQLAVLGNLPYCTATKMLFKLLEHREQVDEVVCMVQREVAERLTASPGSKSYGRPSVIWQTFYKATYCFSVPPSHFSPAPQVHAGVIHLQRNKSIAIPCSESLFFQVVKTAFQQRRKKLRNALTPLQIPPNAIPSPFSNLRAEALSSADFITLTKAIAKAKSYN